MKRIRLISLLLAVLGGACGGPEHGTIVGDVYFALDSGGQVNVQDTPVHLLPQEEGMDSTLAAICDERDRELARLREPALADSAAEARAGVLRAAWEHRARTLDARVQRRVRTDAGAKFVIDSVPAGRYLLWANASLRDERWTWLLPVVVRGGDTTRANLSNSNADDDPFRCYWDPRKEGFLFQ